MAIDNLGHCPGYGVQPDHVVAVEEFHRDRSRPNGLSQYCKSCKRARNNDRFREKYYPQHREAIIEAVKARRSEAAAALGSVVTPHKTATSRETVKIAQAARRTERCTCDRTGGTHRYDCPGYRRERARAARAKTSE